MDIISIDTLHSKIAMGLNAILLDRQIKAKEKTETISQLLLENKISMDELMPAAALSKDS